MTDQLIDWAEYYAMNKLREMLRPLVDYKNLSEEKRQRYRIMFEYLDDEIASREDGMISVIKIRKDNN